MKKLSLTLILSFIYNFGFAQQDNLDSLKTILYKTKKPNDKFGVIVKILETKMVEVNDTSLIIPLHRIAQQLNNDSLLAISYNWIGTYFLNNKGDNTTALEYFFKAIPLAKKAKDNRRISSLYFDIALAYFNLQNNEEAFKNTLKGGQYLPDKSSTMHNYMLVQFQNNMTQYYLTTNQLDSALYYASKSLETSQKLKKKLFEYTSYYLNGAIYSQMGDNIRAENYFKKANAISSTYNQNLGTLRSKNNYIIFLLKNKRITEVRKYAGELLKAGRKTNNNDLKLAGAQFSRMVFDKMHQIDSAYYYSRMEANINAQIFNQNNLNKIQTLNFNEKMRIIEEEQLKITYKNQLKQYTLFAALVLFSLIAFILYRNNQKEKKAKNLLQEQKKKVERTLSQLKATQAQLIQTEKLASLGELTAGIAHEIQNPLNFVNNFSEVSSELVAEMNQELDKGDINEAKAISNDLKENLEKITEHGKRASSIVKGMLEHSRTSTGEKELTDINALADEYLRLAYHGLRAKDKDFNSDFKTDFDPNLPKINVIPQDIGRVLLNLINNAFWAVKTVDKPLVVVKTEQSDNQLIIKVIDNGSGMSQEVKAKIFQPFFTTKPTGQGTGLGLSLAYDIITKGHGGTIECESVEGVGTEFVVKLPNV